MAIRSRFRLLLAMLPVLAVLACTPDNPTASNPPPTANAGPDMSANVGEVVHLDGSASRDPDNDNLAFSWSFVSKPTGSSASFSGVTSASATFAPDVGGQYTVRLTVSDGNASATDDCVVTVNAPPKANAGPDQKVGVGNPVTLDGSGSSDADGDSLTYSWSFVSKPAGSSASLSGATSVSATFTPDVLGQYTVRLTVSDGKTSATDDSAVTVEDRCLGPYPTIAFGQTVAGTLEVNDCLRYGRLRDPFTMAVPGTGAFQATLTAVGFDPFIVAENHGRQTGGRSSTEGSVTAQHVFPAGSYTISAVALGLVSSGTRFAGSYTLSVASVAIPQEGCMSDAFVDFGSLASGRISSDDCLDDYAADAATVTRWYDGYVILLHAGETVTVTLTGDFQDRLSYWTSDGWVRAVNGVVPGVPVTMTVTQPASGAGFHYFYVLAHGDKGTGNYTMSFSGTPIPAPEAVDGTGDRRPPLLLAADPPRRGGGRIR